MKKFSLLTLAFLLITFSSFACTTFFINKNGQMVFGRNYDWVTGNGMVCTNLKGLSKTSYPTTDGPVANWVSKYGSITFNQYGKEFPTGGMNEKGLVVELMWLDGTVYPTADDRPALGVLQWIQYQLDNCSTVDELIAMDKTIRIASKGTSPLHYLVADATGNVATIEFLEGKMTVHKGNDLPFPVLTNDAYTYSIEKTDAVPGSIVNGEHSYGNNSLDRFAKACVMVKAFEGMDMKTPVVDFSFRILDKVAQPGFTRWSIVYDITNKKIFFKTLDYPTIKDISFDAFDLNCSAISLAWDMNQPGSGTVSKLFSNFSMDLNNQMVNRSFDESISRFTVNEEDRKKHVAYAGSVKCEGSR